MKTRKAKLKRKREQERVRREWRNRHNQDVKVFSKKKMNTMKSLYGDMSQDQAASKIQARWKGRNARRDAKINKIKKRREARLAK